MVKAWKHCGGRGLGMSGGESQSQICEPLTKSAPLAVTSVVLPTFGGLTLDDTLLRNGPGTSGSDVTGIWISVDVGPSVDFGSEPHALKHAKNAITIKYLFIGLSLIPEFVE
jgi:hypothetical protein